MKTFSFLSIATVLPFVVGNAIPNENAILYKRKVPEATPTGPFCTATGPSAPTATLPSPSEVASAVAGCQGVTATGQTANDIVNGICKPFTLLFARGTTETGNIGSIVGPPFVLALQNAFGANNVAVQGVNNYPATANDYCTGGSITGSQNLAQVRPLFVSLRSCSR